MRLTLWLSGFWHGHNKMLLSKEFSRLWYQLTVSPRAVERCAGRCDKQLGRNAGLLYCVWTSVSLAPPLFGTRMLGPFSHLLCALHSPPPGRHHLSVSCGRRTPLMSKLSCSFGLLLTDLSPSDRRVCSLRTTKT